MHTKNAMNINTPVQVWISEFQISEVRILLKECTAASMVLAIIMAKLKQNTSMDL